MATSIWRDEVQRLIREEAAQLVEVLPPPMFERELLERGFEVAVVKDATAGARHPDLGDGYQAALVNFGYIANEVVTTEEIVRRLKETARQAG